MRFPYAFFRLRLWFVVAVLASATVCVFGEMPQAPPAQGANSPPQEASAPESKSSGSQRAPDQDAGRHFDGSRSSTPRPSPLTNKRI